jgi:hypothetical protein
MTTSFQEGPFSEIPALRLLQQLTLLRTQRTALNQQKRGLMQRLLTGKIRVTTS